MMELTTTPMFGFSLCLFSYIVAVKINQKTKLTILNPLLLSAIFVIVFLWIFKIPLENFMVGADFVSMFIAPATAALAVNIYRQYEVIKNNFLPILVGCSVGAASAILSVVLMCKLLGIDGEILISLIPKSVTTPFAIKLSAQMGGLEPVTMAAVFVTGLTGALMAPFLEKLGRIKNPIATGLAVGASSHALGTSKALEMGEIEGTLSGIAVGLCGIVTVLICMFL